ncbi:MAG: segregation/condensation protein A [Holophagales bacterium]|jgi:segregation and condensation protein A|nr:segregation/condensation protein A [Holophagales bacterium]
MQLGVIILMENMALTNFEREAVADSLATGLPPTRFFEPPKGFESKFRDMSLDLPLFEGPLDLLLHLIRDQKLDILDLPIASVTKQYMDYLLLMEELNLEIAAEFIAMAAQLIQIKSRMLLPVPPKEGEAEDPREELVQKLLNYQAIKEAAKELAEMESDWQNVVFVSGLDIQDHARTEDEPIKATLMDLLGAYRDALKRLLPPPPVEVMTPQKTLEQRIAEVLDILQGGDWLPFVELLAKSRNREELVLTFLALLELVKNGRAKLVQSETFGEIRVQAA